MNITAVNPLWGIPQQQTAGFCLEPGEHHPGPCPGGGKGGGLLKRLIPKAKAVAHGRKRGPGSGRDITKEIDYAKLPKLGTFTVTSGQDEALAAIAKQQGFDAHPEIGSKADLDRAVKEGGRELWRGVEKSKDGKYSAADYAEQFRSGDPFFGLGQHGNGIYAGDKSTANKYGDYQPGGVVRMVLPKGARTTTSEELKKHLPARHKEFDEHGKKLLKAAEKSDGRDGALAAYETWVRGRSQAERTLQDLGRLAAALGYDAYEVQRGGGQNFWVIVNRGALLVEQAEDHVTASAGRVEACRKIKVGGHYPPGPCPKHLPGTTPAKKAVAKRPGAKDTASKDVTSQSGPGSGRDLFASLDMAAISKLPKRAPDGRDGQLTAIAKLQGFDGLPELGAAQQLDAAIAAGGREIWRGTKNDYTGERSGEELAEQFRTGPAFFGQGISGNGIYTSTDQQKAIGYTSEHDMRAVNRMVLKPGSKVIGYGEVIDRMGAEIPADTAQRIAALGVAQREVFKAGRYPEDVTRAASKAAETLQPQGWLWMDPQQWAMAHGYDAVLHGFGDWRDDDPGFRKELVLLNRGAVLVEQASAPPRTLQEIYGYDFAAQASVTACLKPGEVHPGPCAQHRPDLLPKIRVRAKKRPASGRARDITGDLDYDALDVLPIIESGKGNQVLAAIAARQGFTGTPAVVTAEQFDREIRDNGATRLFRAVKPAHGKTAGQIQDQFRNGEAFYGLGKYGNGFYFANDTWIAEAYADHSDPRSLAQFALPKDAHTVLYEDLLREMAAEETPGQKAMTEIQRQLLEDLAAAQDITDMRRAWSEFDFQQQITGTARDRVLADPGAFAMAKGYDAIVVPVVNDVTETVVLNRGKLIARQPDADRGILASGGIIATRGPVLIGRDAPDCLIPLADPARARSLISSERCNITVTLAGADISDLLVQACRPPHVPVPKPGPCPKVKDALPGLPKPARKKAVAKVKPPAQPASPQLSGAPPATGAAALKAAPIRDQRTLEVATSKPDPQFPGDDLWRVPKTVNGVDGSKVREAVADYAGNGYQYVNWALRSTGGDPGKFPAALPPDVGKGLIPALYTPQRVRDIQTGIDAAMTASKLRRPVKVQRGVVNPRDTFGQAWLPDGDNTGLSWRDDAYVSTTVRPATAKKFAGYGAGVVLNMTVPQGTGAVGIENLAADFSGERELLLNRGLAWRVTRDWVDDAGVRNLDVEVAA